MTGGIIITHAGLAAGLKEAAEMIIGPQENFEAIPLEEGEGLEILTEKIRKTAEGMDAGEIVLFTDLFGATPCNASSLLCAEFGYPVAAGVNLPVLLEFLTSREGEETEELLKKAEETAAESFRVVRRRDLTGED